MDGAAAQRPTRTVEIGPDEAVIQLPQDGYPTLLFIEHGRPGEWTSYTVSAPDLPALDRRARNVLRAYAIDLLNRLATADALAAGTFHVPGQLRIDLDDD